MSLAPGTKVGPYDVVAALGVGGMGQVYRARDPRLNRTVALSAHTNRSGTELVQSAGGASGR